MAFSAVCIGDDAPGGSADALLALQGRAAHRHRERGVRGLLVCGPGFVLHWIEGEESRVRAALEDLGREAGQGRLTPVFAAAGPALLDASSTALLSLPDAGTRVAAVDDLLAGRLPEGGAAAIVRRLLEPGVPGEGCRRVGLFGQNGTWPGALMDGLQARSPAAVRHRTRLLGSVGFEREAFIEQLDHDDPDHGAVRVVNHSGDLLAASWMRGRIEPLDVAALFFSGATHESVDAFARAMADPLALTNPRTPLVCFFGRTAARFAPAIQAAFGDLGRTVRLSDAPVAESKAVWQEIARSLDVPPPAAPPRPGGPPPLPAPPPWFEHLLAIDGVAAVGLLGAATGGAPCLRLRSGPADERLSREFQAWGDASPAWPGAAQEPVQWLVRWQDRLTLLQSLPSCAATVFVAGEDGFTNESWLRLEVGRVLRGGPPVVP